MQKRLDANIENRRSVGDNTEKKPLLPFHGSYVLFFFFPSRSLSSPPPPAVWPLLGGGEVCGGWGGGFE